MFVANAAHAATCPTGTYVPTGAETDTVVSVDATGHCPTGYAVYDAPTQISGYFGGALISTDVILCDSGQYMNNGVCTSYSAGRCDSGYVQVNPDSATISAVDSTGHCMPGFAPSTTPTWMYIISTGATLSSGPTLCNSGQYMNNGVCTSYDNTGCPSGWINYVSGTTDTFVPTASGACGTNYLSTTDFADCKSPGNSDFCGAFCSAGESLTYGGTCVPLCGIGVTEFHAGNLVFPIYAQKTTSPALHLKIGNSEICYVNLAPGTASGALNISKSNGETYHTVQ